jgi:L-ascorbate metabolism protein UlaG (beta-lactamase superfamily)
MNLTWYGVSTFELQVGGVVLFLDAYLDRVSAAPPNGLSSADVTTADSILIGHSHFDHLYGAQTISNNTGARIIGSHETVRLMAEAGVPADRLLAVGGGELIELAPEVYARVLPSLHSCTWAATTPDAERDEHRVPQHERERRLASGLVGRIVGAPELLDHVLACGEQPRGDGGAFGYLIETPTTRLYWADTSGYWSGVIRDLRPDIAVLAAAARGNVDGEPTGEDLPGFIATEVERMRPGQVVLCHHDDWMPPATSTTDVEPIRAAVAARCPDVPVHSLAFGEPLEI